jgi:hypothetical protein
VKYLDMFRILSARIALAMMLLFCCSYAEAQSASGKVTGIITDAQGAVLPDVDVTVTNAETGQQFVVKTKDSGIYEVLQLPIGSYTVKVQKESFETVVTAPNPLGINQTVRVDIRMAMGTVSQVVSVDTQAAQVETENPTIGSTITGAAVQDLPLNGRDPMSLLQTQAGVSGSFSSNSSTGSIAGGRNDNVNFLLDGGSNNVVRSSTLNFDPNPDTVAEFRVLMNNYTAEYGRSGGGVVSVVTKSGTKTFHGSVFNYLRNTAFNANNYFLNQTNQPRAVLQRNQFGGTIGGPVFIPRLIPREKLFFFFSYQGQRQNQTSVGSVSTVFTPAMLNGDFSAASAGKPDASVAAFLKANPYYQANAALAAQAIIDQTKINSVFQKFNAAKLLVNNTSGTYVPALPTKTNYNQYSAKVDYSITAKDHLTGTYGYQTNPTLSAGNTNFPLSQQATNTFLTLDYTRTFTASLLNDFRASVTRQHQLQNNPTTTTPGPTALGINISPDKDLGTPQMTMPSGYLSLGYNPNNAVLADTTYNYADTLTWIKGRHTLKFGFSLIAMQENSDYNYQTMGGFYFYGSSTSIGSGNPLADFEFGLPDEFSQYPAAFSNMRSKIYAGFGQDEFKISRNLQITFGMRYEYGTPQRDTLGRSFSIIPNEQSQRFVAAPVGIVFPGDPGAPNGLYFPDKNNFAPRLGIAWDPFGDGKTSVRTGFGVFYNILNGWTQDWNNGVPPFYAGVDFSSNGGNPLGPVTAAPQYLNSPYSSNGQPNPFPSHITLSSSDPSLFLNLAALPFGGSAYATDIHLRSPYIYNYNLSVQRQLVKNLSLDVSYVGSRSHKLNNQQDANPIILGTNVRLLNNGRYPYFNDPDRGLTTNGLAPIPNFTENNGFAYYDGLLVTLNKRFSENRMGSTFFTAAYTWSHNIDNGTGAVGNASGNVPYYNHAALRGNAVYDQRQRFTLAGGWQLPFDHMWSSGPKALTSGWTLLPIFSMYSGSPFDVSAALKNNTVGNKAGSSGAGDPQLTRAQLTVAKPTTLNPHTSSLHYLVKTDYTVPTIWNSTSYIPTAAQRTYGMSRDSIPGIGVVNLDFAVTKKTALYKDRINTELRFEAFNALNHTEFANPNTSVSSSLFGQVTSVLGNRVGQVALRIQF